MLFLQDIFKIRFGLALLLDSAKKSVANWKVQSSFILDNF